MSEKREQWPTDDAFRKFAAKVADACQAYQEVLRTGRCCPMGAAAAATVPTKPGYAGIYSHPTSQIASRILSLPDNRVAAFMRGFDEMRGFGPYYRLGLAYRRRFVTKENGDV